MSKYAEMSLEDLKELTIAELQEAKSELEATEGQLDVDRYNVIVNTLSEKETTDVTDSDATETVTDSTSPYEFIQKVDFDTLTGRNGINRLVQLLLDKKSASVTAQVTEGYETLVTSLKTGFEEERTSWDYQNKKLQDDLKAVTEEKNTYKLSAEDLDSRFKALEQKYADDIAEKDTEIKRLKDREFELQQQVANAPAPTVRKAIDVSSYDDLDELVRELNAQKVEEEKAKEVERLANRPKITNKRWEKEFGYGSQTVYLAELVGNYEIGKDGETIKINRLDINQYQEVSADDAARFRAELAATSQTANAEVAVSDSPLVTTEVQPVESVPTFQTEVQPVAGLDTSGTTEVVQPTLEERVAILEKKVAELETVCA